MGPAFLSVVAVLSACRDDGPSGNVVLNSPTFNAPAQVGGQGNVSGADPKRLDDIRRRLDDIAPDRQALAEEFSFGYCFFWIRANGTRRELNTLNQWQPDAAGVKIHWESATLLDLTEAGALLKPPRVQSVSFNIADGAILVPLNPPVPMDVSTAQVRMVARAIMTDPIVVLIGFGRPIEARASR